jgi:protein MAK11
MPKKYHCLLNGEIRSLLLPICLILPQELAALYTLEHASRIHDIKFVQRVDGRGEVLLVAAEDKKTTVYEVSPDTRTIMHPIAYLVGHENRCAAKTI